MTGPVLVGRLPLVGWLVVVWMALWGDLSLANLLSGVAVAVGLVVAFPEAGPRPLRRLRPARALAFLGYFLYKLVEANIVVAWEIVTPNNDSINEGIVAVPVTGASDAAITVLANAISLTPGTLTLEVSRDPPVLYVHVLHLRDLEQVRRELYRLERLALRAFASDAALRACTSPPLPAATPSYPAPDEEDRP